MDNEIYMKRALQLAKNGLGFVSPNPMVGCVIVYNNEIIGEGWHQKFGEAHAEVNAINSVENKSLLSKATVYVTLEPCSYKGKTPACSGLLIKSGVKKVVIATLDPNPKVAGNGINALKEAGVEVEMGLMGNESRALNKRFFINQKLSRPYIILKWAQTKDGFIARKNFDSKWISNEHSRQLVHKWRAEEDAILVGKNTAHYDNPLLTVRNWEGRNPIRIVLDRNLELSSKLNLFNGKVETLVYNVKDDKQEGTTKFIKLESQDFLSQLLNDAYNREIGSVIIEGGSQILAQFIALGLWDEARVFTSSKLFGEGINAPQVKEVSTRKEDINQDELNYYFNSKTTIHWQKN